MSTEEKKPGIIAEKKGFTVELEYSKKAEKNQLIKFTAKKGDSFEVSADDLIELLAAHVNSKNLQPLFVNSERITMVYVKRNIQARLDRDFAAGEVVNFEYEHPYPLEFAILEEAHKLALIDPNREGVVITPELLQKVKRATPKKSEHFITTFLKSFKNTVLGGKT